MEELQLESDPNQKNQIYKYVIAVISIVIFLVLFLFFVFSKEEVQDTYYFKKQSKFIVHDLYDVPTRDDFGRGITASLVFVNFLESTYRYQGFQKEHLNSTQFTQISVEYMLKYIKMTCTSNPKKSPCPSIFSDGKLGEITINDVLDFFDSFPKAKSSMVPEKACPIENQTLEQVCQSVGSSTISQNPLQFSITDRNYINGINQIKLSLQMNGYPIPISMPIPANRHWFSCNHNFVKNSQICQDQLNTEAPVDFYDEGSYSKSLIHHIEGEMAQGPTASFLLYGFDDDFIEEQTTNVTDRPPEKGALFLKTPFGSGAGHSLEYLRGDIPASVEASICPNDQDPFSWVPSYPECIQKYNPEQCSTDISKNGATVLACTDSSLCKTGLFYVLQRAPNTTSVETAKEMSFGVAPAFIMWDAESPMETLRYPELPFGQVSRAFSPILRRPNSERCGFMALSYRAWAELSSVVGPGGKMGAYPVRVEWADRSFPSGRSGMPLTRASMGNMWPITIDSPNEDL